MSNVIFTDRAPVTHVVAAPAPQVTNVVTTAVVPQGPRIRENYPTKTSIALGIVQIISGGVAVLFGILALVWESYNGGSAYGIWCGIPIIGGGVAGVCAGKTKTIQAITAFLVMSVIDICVAGLMGCIALAAVVEDSKDYTEVFWPYGLYESTQREYHADRVAASAIVLVAAIFAASAFLWSSIIAGNCCQSSPATGTTYITHTTNPTVTTHTVMAAQMQPAPYPQQPQMQYAYNGPAQPQYGAPMPPQPAQPVQPPQYGIPPESYEKPPAYAPQ